MSLGLVDKDRKVIPRWRSVDASVYLGELRSLRSHTQVPSSVPDFMPKKIDTWERNRSIIAASELVEAAIVSRQVECAVEAAEFLLSRPENLRSGIVSNAHAVRVMAGRVLNQQTDMHAASFLDQQQSIAIIGNLKHRLVDNPRNGLVWAEISRHQTILGQKKSSIRAMDRALFIYPTNRYLLRSAARLLVHWEETDRAQWLLRKNRRVVQTDPWLLSADIVVNEIMGGSSLLLKDGIASLADHSLSDFEKSELASAIATTEIGSGTLKKARKYFRQSLLAPTENSLAQASWAARRDIGFDAPLNASAVPHTFEASAWDAVQRAEWDDALAQIDRWADDEPFSSRPLDIGGYISLTVLLRPERTEHMMRRALISNPHEFAVKNNLVVALALQNRIEEAQLEYEKIASGGIESTEEIAYIATRGLINFRSGDPDNGRSLYREAAEMGKARNLPHEWALALLCWAQEEGNWNVEERDRLILEAESVPNVSRQTDLTGMAKRLRNESETVNNQSQNGIIYQFNAPGFAIGSRNTRIVSDEDDDDNQILILGGS